jgi:hypothetical protein
LIPQCATLLPTAARYQSGNRSSSSQANSQGRRSVPSFKRSKKRTSVESKRRRFDLSSFFHRQPPFVDTPEWIEDLLTLLHVFGSDSTKSPILALTKKQKWKSRIMGTHNHPSIRHDPTQFFSAISETSGFCAMSTFSPSLMKHELNLQF